MATPVDAPCPGTSTPSRRLVWADAAKGACIALVVLHHLVTKHYVLVAGDGTLESIWLTVTDLVRPVRMPLFFLISGTFAASAVRRPWREVVRRRTASPYYLYAVWLLIHAVVFSYATALPMNRSQTLGELGQDLLLASTQLWYLYALAAYFVLAKLLLRLDPRLVLGVAATVSAAASMLPIEAANRESVLQHFVFFLAGALAPALLQRIADLPCRPTIAWLAAGTIAAWSVAGALGLPQSTSTLLVSLVGVPLAVRLVAAASQRAWFAGPASALGRQTLPVYVMHVPLLSLLHHVAVPLPAEPGALRTAVVLAYPVAATALVTAGCLLVHRLLLRCGFGWLFRMPAPRTGSSGADPAPISPRRSRAGSRRADVSARRPGRRPRTALRPPASPPLRRGASRPSRASRRTAGGRTGPASWRRALPARRPGTRTTGAGSRARGARPPRA